MKYKKHHKCNKCGSIYEGIDCDGCLFHKYRKTLTEILSFIGGVLRDLPEPEINKPKVQNL